MCFNSACTNQLYKQSRNMCVKCHMDRELPYGRKDFLRYIIRIPLLHILVNSLLCSANTTAKEVIFMSILLKNFAFSLQSKDNISVLVVKFNPKEDRTGFYYKNEVEILPEHVNNEEPDDLFPITQQRSRRRR